MCCSLGLDCGMGPGMAGSLSPVEKAWTGPKGGWSLTFWGMHWGQEPLVGVPLPSGPCMLWNLIDPASRGLFPLLWLAAARDLSKASFTINAHRRLASRSPPFPSPRSHHSPWNVGQTASWRLVGASFGISGSSLDSHAVPRQNSPSTSHSLLSCMDRSSLADPPEAGCAARLRDRAQVARDRLVEAVIRNARVSVGPCRRRSITAIAPLAPITSPAETTDLASPAHSPIPDWDHVGRGWWEKAILLLSNRGKAGFSCAEGHTRANSAQCKRVKKRETK